MDERETGEHLGARPVQGLADVIVKGESDSGEHLDLQEPQQCHLDEARAAVRQDHEGAEDDQERVLGGGDHDTEEKADRSRARIAHEHPAGRDIVPEIAVETTGEECAGQRPIGPVRVVRDEQIVGLRSVPDHRVEEQPHRGDADRRQAA